MLWRSMLWRAMVDPGVLARRQHSTRLVAAAHPYALGTAATVGDFESTATAPANGGGDAGGAGSGASPNAADCSALPEEEKEARKPRPLSATSVTNVTNLRNARKGGADRTATPRRRG